MIDRTTDLKQQIIEAGYKAVEELIEVAKSKIIKINFTDEDDSDLAADKMKNAAQAKKLAIFDALEILSRIETEKESLQSITDKDPRTESNQSFAERRAK